MKSNVKMNKKPKLPKPIKFKQTNDPRHFPGFWPIQNTQGDEKPYVEWLNRGNTLKIESFD